MTAKSLPVSAKLNRPRLPKDTLLRERLLERLQAGRDRPVILVSAPAGYGKTTLVNLWLTTIAADCAWLSLDEYDDSLPDFLAYLFAAVGLVAPGIGHDALSLIEASAPQGPERLAGVFLQDLAPIDHEFYIVLDDYHALQSPQIHQFMERVVGRAPRDIHLILITRADPPLHLARLRGRNQLAELRGVQLRFSEEEAGAFVNQVLGAPVAPEVLRLLTERTEGWPVGLQLAAISLRDQADQIAFATAFARSTDHQVAEYLVQEVLHEMPEAQKNFLLECSILDRVCGQLCDAVLSGNVAMPRAQQFLEMFWKRNLFLIALDGQGQWYRFHHLFHSLLRHHLEMTHTKAADRRAACPPADGLKCRATWTKRYGIISPPAMPCTPRGWLSSTSARC
ncbi:MAG: AAA family ATPase [Anaerolineales bacterium]|nr:AAA family ATPase [Anaerolineales bacterium]